LGRETGDEEKIAPADGCGKRIRCPTARKGTYQMNRGWRSEVSQAKSAISKPGLKN